LLKNHQVSTTGLAEVVREAVPGLAAYGGLVLNTATGGFNIEAVDVAIRMGARLIWMPTRSAANERAFLGRAGEGLPANQPALREILRLIAEADIVLGTAHLSAEEIVWLVGEARRAGVRKILVNHPEIEFVALSEHLQREISGPGVWFERCYCRRGFLLDWDQMAAVTRRVGYESTVLATDLGQPENPDPVTGLAEMAARFRARGFSEAELRVMLCENPARLLGLS
jgi:hypothetical protein